MQSFPIHNKIIYTNKMSKEISNLNNLPSEWLVNPYIEAATSSNTRKAYRSDVAHYETWGGKLPATPEYIARYLQEFADKLNPRTLARRLIALRHWHEYQGFPDPTHHPAIAKTMTGILRIHGKPKDKARPLTPNELAEIVKCLAKSVSLSAIRDSALLQIGYFGALRRSELVAIDYEHIAWSDQGIEILLPGSKTDQAHVGQYCTIPYGNATLCAVSALRAWLEHAGINQGALFRRILSDESLGSGALTAHMVNRILKARAEEANIADAEHFSSHSLRRGLATSAARAGAPLHAIMRAGRWKQTNTVVEYIESSERYSDNAAGIVLEEM